MTEVTETTASPPPKAEWHRGITVSHPTPDYPNIHVYVSPHPPFDSTVPRVGSVSVSLSPEDARALAHMLLRAVGDTVVTDRFGP
jgi:hypothetical protein